MKKILNLLKRITTCSLIVAMSCYTMTGCSSTQSTSVSSDSSASSATEVSSESTPKYVFLFIGDGMSYPQVQLTNYYLSAKENDEDSDILSSKNQLSFFDFDVTGSAQTYDSTSFCPDSASTATAMSTGNKTYSGTINMDETGTVPYETIAEKLKSQLGFKIGVVSSVNVNHATPAAFYAHQVSRDNYYDIGLELIDSGFDYFAGGAFKEPTGENEDQTDLYSLAEEAGYNVITTQADAESLTSEDGKSIVISETLADSKTMPYSLDLEEDEWSLADYVSKGIDVLSEDNDDGFFMMVEGGKIDWACHANDASSAINDTIALDDAVDEAIAFYNEHPDETLILVTGDHETGGLTLGYAGTNYDTFLTNLENQKISYAKYDSDYVENYKTNNTDFDTVMQDITALFGLEAPRDSEYEKSVDLDSLDSHPESDDDGSLEMTNYEYEELKAAYEETMTRTDEDESSLSQEEYDLYGSYEPLTVTITHILNNKSGISFSSYSHTGLPVGVYATGAGSELFDGYYDNTDIYNKLASLTGVE